MSWILILYFTCAVGCGEPASLTLPFVYDTEQVCTEAGNVWLRPKANPTRTVASFSCGNGSGGGPGQASLPHKREYGATAPGECAIGFSEETCRRRGLKYNPPRQN